MKKRLVIALALLALLSTYKPQRLFSLSNFNLEKIIIENNNIIKDKNIKKKLTFLYDKNLIFLNNNDIVITLKEIDFIESFEIKKIYPNKLKIKIFEKNPIAILQNKKKKFYVSENIDLINYKFIQDYKNLPIVFGDIDNFEIFFKNLKKINFPLELIKKYYFYESKRWDMEIEDKIIIKLPPKNYTKSLENFMNLRSNNNFDKYKVFDYRINNQLILK
jgi:cell division septal protein FtsQ